MLDAAGRTYSVPLALGMIVIVVGSIAVFGIYSQRRTNQRAAHYDGSKVCDHSWRFFRGPSGVTAGAFGLTAAGFAIADIFHPRLWLSAPGLILIVVFTLLHRENQRKRRQRGASGDHP